MKTPSLIPCLLALALLLAAPLASSAATVVVTNLADSGPGTLRQAVIFANTNAGADTITFDAALSGKTNVLMSGQVTISNVLTIDASALPAGFKVSGNHSSRIFEVSAGATVTLKLLFLTNGYAGSGGWGGAILVDSGGTLTLTNCTVSGNSATGVGGGIGNSFGVVTINNSTLSGNAASYAAAIENDGGTLTINASTLSGNIATNNGGAIDNDAGATLRVNNSTFSGNTAIFGGGGGFESYQATAILNNCTLSANSAGGGGGINNFDGPLALTNTIVAGNTAPSAPNISSSTSFTGANNLIDGDPRLAPLGNYGGPTLTMPPQPGSPAIDGGLDSVTNFLATDQRGTPRRYGVHVDIGAVESQLLGVSNLNDNGPGSLRDTIAAGGQSLIGFAASLAGGTLTLTNGQIALNNNVTIDVSALPDGLTISGNNSNRIFEVNPGATVTLHSLGFVNGNAGSGAGGAIRVDAGGTLIVTNGAIYNNSAHDGGGIVNYGTLTLQFASVDGNRASGNGGGIQNEGGTLTLQAVELEGNQASGNGGGIENEGGTLTINAGSDIGYNSAAYGGGIASRSASAKVNIIQSTIWYNQATNNAGGIANTNGSALTLINSTVSGNSAGGAGGGLEVLQATVTSINSTISANSAASAGGITNNGTLAFTNTIVAGNTAAGGSTNLFNGPGGSFSGANNLTNGNPLLATLATYLAWPPTSPPLHGSPAIDAGLDSVTNALVTDERGYARRSGAHVDIGAVEAQWAAPGNPPLLTGLARDSDGTFSFSFTSASVADFTVLGSSNVALPLSQWSVLDAAVQDFPGECYFTDLNATNYPRRFYRAVSP